MYLATIDVQTPRGKDVTLFHREGYTDLSTIGAIFRLWGQLHDEYGLAALHPRTFLDIGGHIGTVTVAVLVDNPECRAVIVEPLPENIDVIKANLEATGVADRCEVLQGGIGDGDTVRVGYTLARVENADDIHRFVGSPVPDDYAGEAITANTYAVRTLVDRLGGHVDLAKWDCEGCEWIGLEAPAIVDIDMIVGEYHGDPGPDGLQYHLGAFFELTTEPHDHGATGMFTAVRR